ncbi:MAG: cystathionine gamma-lyase [Segniliparus sp.]|uniref:cystathionine gamma-lyase n=1 Tax=Segniliparus sp. TaxID=2804064 RepID=UPI003F3DB44D
MSRPEEPGPSTRCVRTTSSPHEPGTPLSPSPVFTSTYHALPAGEPGDFYGRNSNPIWRALEAAFADLERAQAALVFPTGMGAITAVLRALCAGGTLLVPSDGYYQTRVYAGERLAAWGVEVRTERCAAFTAAIRALAEASQPRVVFAETPVNPTLDVLDLREAAAAAREVGAILVVDNTAATPFGQVPLDFGVDLVVASATKGLCGHSDITLGYIAANRPDLVQAVERERTVSGATTGPFEAWLAHRSLATAALRFDRQCANAQAVAEFLNSEPQVRSVRYPGLASDPSHALAARQMSRFGSLVSIELESLAAAQRFLARSELLVEATSFGGVHSTADRRARWGDAVPEGFLRLSIGIEDERDLLADLGHALG